MNHPLLDVLIETAPLQLDRLYDLPRNENTEELIAIQQERLLRLLAEAQKN